MFCLLDAQAVRERRGSMKTTKKLPEFRMARAEGFLVNERLETKKALLGGGGGGYVGYILCRVAQMGRQGGAGWGRRSSRRCAPI